MSDSVARALVATHGPLRRHEARRDEIADLGEACVGVREEREAAAAEGEVRDLEPVIGPARRQGAAGEVSPSRAQPRLERGA
jgi:hypothetical protein